MSTKIRTNPLSCSRLSPTVETRRRTHALSRRQCRHAVPHLVRAGLDNAAATVLLCSWKEQREKTAEHILQGYELPPGLFYSRKTNLPSQEIANPTAWNHILDFSDELRLQERHINCCWLAIPTEAHQGAHICHTDIGCIVKFGARVE